MDSIKNMTTVDRASVTLANWRETPFSRWSFQNVEPDGAYCAIGIHGQWLYVDPENEAVIVKLSSQPNPLDDELKQDNLAFFRTLSRLAL